MSEPRVLFIDDDETAREVARYNLSRSGYGVDVAGSAEEGLTRFDVHRHRVVVTDLRLPGRDGLHVLESVKAKDPDVTVVVITAYGDIQTAVGAMRAGAWDFIPKPFDRAQLTLTVDRALERARLVQDNRALKRALGGVERQMVHASALMDNVLQLVDRVAPSTATVLITGESGTGKELIARRLHARSDRSSGPFVVLNCAAIPAELLESELFGHSAGAFTGASRDRKGRFRQADGGSLFLDELGELPLSLQSKLLRVLQEGQVDPLGLDHPVDIDVRVIAATNQDLGQAVSQGRFREDLFYRLNVVEIPLPPLRKRRDDIPSLARHFVDAAAQGRDLSIPPEVLAAMMDWPWPGNVRELSNACERLALLCPGETLRLEDLPRGMLAEPAPAQGSWLDALPSELSLMDLEREVIAHTLRRCTGNLSAAARALGVPRHILAYRVQKYGISGHD